MIYTNVLNRGSGAVRRIANDCGEEHPILQTLNRDGDEVSPRAVVVPICQRMGYRRYRIVGTGFYVTRYGLLATAAHVLTAMVNTRTGLIEDAFVLQEHGESSILFRPLVSASISNVVDVGLVQLETQTAKGIVPPNPRTELSWSCPADGEALVTYAYPQNYELSHEEGAPHPTILCDYIEGSFLEEISADQRPFIRYPHYETSLCVPDGASGALVFDPTGRVIGICCRAWDFGEGEQSATPLSSVVPTTYLRTIGETAASPPEHSWEFAQLPEALKGSRLSFDSLVHYGHVLALTGPAPASA